MPIRVGILAEGNDHLVLLAYLAKLLGVPEEELDGGEPIGGGGHGWQFVLKLTSKALRRFYTECVQLVILSVDNDGNLNILEKGGQEDPRHPRHWLHAGQGEHPECRHCLIRAEAEKTRPFLNWIDAKPPERWPILIAVPVEAIEAWLLTTWAILDHGAGSMCAEQELRSTLKQRMYGRPGASLDDVERIALPLIRRLDDDHLQVLKDHSRSFSDFATQVDGHAEEIRTNRDCWS